MPRGVKGSGKAKVVKTAPVAEKKEVKTRKSYPSYEERIEMADQQIERLTKLNESRIILINKTESTLNERKAALEKSQKALDKVVAKKQRIIENHNKPAKASGIRAAKAAEKQEIEALYAALKASGKSVDEVIAKIND